MSSATSGAAGRFYRPELDLLRFFAFMLVFGYHVLPAGGGLSFPAILRGAGGFGVSVFFLLSAYLITELLFREKTRTGAVDFKAFYIRRILRIWPIYFLFLLAVAAIGLRFSSLRIPAPALAAYFLLVGNWYGYLPSIAGPLWSIGVEEQFYLTWPFVMRSVSRVSVIWVSLALWAASQGSVLWLGYHKAIIYSKVWPNSFVHLQYFALGALLSAILNGSQPRFNAVVRSAMIAVGFSLILLARAFMVVGHSIQKADIWHTCPDFALAGVGAATLFLGFLGMPCPEFARPLVTLGKISYGLYVYDPACLFATSKLLHTRKPVATSVLALTMTVAVAYVSYRWLETPFLRLKKRFTSVRSRAI